MDLHVSPYSDSDFRYINIDIIHGGSFSNNSSYIGGETKVMEKVLWLYTNFCDVEALVKSFGYVALRKSAFRVLGGAEQYSFFHDDESFNNLVSHHIDWDKNVAKIYCECIVGHGNEDEELHRDLTYKGKNRVIVEEKPRINRLHIVYSDGGSEEDWTSEYESSGDSPRSLDSDEELGYTRSIYRNRQKTFRPHGSKKGLVLELGLTFTDYTECKKGIRDWAIENGYNITWTKSDEKKIAARCYGDCPWRLYASRLPHEATFVLKTLIDHHTCVRSCYNRQANCEWLVDILMPHLRRNDNYPVKDMIMDVLLKYGINVKEDLCYTAKWKALSLLRGSFEDHYKNLKSYVIHLKRMDKDGRFYLHTYLNDSDQPVFQRVYIGFSALKKGFLVGCRKCICFDACFLKTVLGGVLLAAIAKDCNDKLWPIAWAVAEKENEETWTWFFENLFEDLNIRDGFGWTFMSDKHRGIINGIHKLTPLAEHRHCARHVYANWKKQFPIKLFKDSFWSIANSGNEIEYYFQLDKLKKISKPAYDAFMVREPRTFCKSLIDSLTRTDMIENNICESFNNYIIRFRDKPIIDMLEGIRQKLMSRMPKMVRKLNMYGDILCPNVKKKLGKLQEKIQTESCVVKPAMENKFEVHCSKEIVIVDLINKECSCRLWVLTGIPCFHALACIRYNRDDPVLYVDDFYHRANCLAAYNHYLSPIYGPKDWPVVEGHPILPPPYVRQPGRIKKSRRKAIDEGPSRSKHKLTNKGLRNACSRCHQFGHNKRRCNEQVPQQQDQSIKRNPGRPRKSISTTHDATGSSVIEQRDLRQVRSGFGVLIGESGNIYVRPPGSNHTRVITTSQSSRVEAASQSSQVVDGNTHI